MVKRKIINSNILGYTSIGILSLITLALLLPSADNSAHATCADGDTSEGCVTTRASMEAEVNVGTSIAIAMDSKVTMDITPSSTGSVSAVSSKVQVATNSIDGYALFMKADPALVNTSTANDGAVVNSITNTTTTSTLSNMVENTYGYSISEAQLDDKALMNTVYAPLDTTGTTPIRQTTSTSIGTSNTDYGYGEEYYLNLGVKVGTNLPAGTYAGTVTLSAVANPVTVRSMAGLKYMQDMTTDICANTIEHYTKRLTDTRDGKEYWVAKLRDGNCWMVQNLALDITEAGLKASDTDIEYDWTAVQTGNGTVISEENNNLTYAPMNTESEIGVYKKPITPTDTQSWNYWQHYVLALPSLGKACKNIRTSTESCSVLFDVGDDGWQPTYEAQTGIWPYAINNLSDEAVSYLPGTYSGLLAVDTLSNKYDAHYLVGNYYLWNAATAGTGGTLGENGFAQASGSICAKGWQLPVSPGTSDFAVSKFVDKSTDKLFASYNLVVNGTLNVNAGDEMLVINQPLYRTATGMAYAQHNQATGDYGWWWGNGATTVGADNAVNGLRSSIHLNGAAVNLSPSNYSMPKYSGLSVRCVAR